MLRREDLQKTVTALAVLSGNWKEFCTGGAREVTLAFLQFTETVEDSHKIKKKK